MDGQDNGKPYYSVEECAKLLTISKGLCYELVRQKRIPAIRLGERRLVVPKVALAAALEAMLVEQSNIGIPE